MVDFSDKDIALVGNAESLLNMRYGTMIDSHDMVVRMNRLPTENERASLGWRTDLFCYSSGIFVPKGYDGVVESVHNFDISGYDYSDRPSSGMRLVYHIVKYTNYKSLTLYGFDFMNSVSLTSPSRVDNPHDFSIEGHLINSYAEYGVLNICQ